MEQVIIGLVGLNLMIAVYQEHARRADTAGLRKEIAALRDELKEEISGGLARVNGRIDGLVAIMADLAEKVGEVRGRTEVLATVE